MKFSKDQSDRLASLVRRVLLVLVRSNFGSSQIKLATALPKVASVSIQ